MGSVAFYMWPRGRRATINNFRRVLRGRSEREIRAVARRSLVNYCRYLVDFLRFPSFTPQDLRRLVQGEQSFRALDDALTGGKGAIIVCMHFGNWDLGAGAAGAREYAATVVVESFRDSRLDAMVVGARERLGVRVVRMEKAGPSILRTLKQNGVLALLIDRPVPGDGVRVNFFDEPVEVPAGPARLALRSGAKVVPAAFARVRPNGPDVLAMTDFSIQFEPNGDEEGDVRRLTQAIMTAHEGFVRQYPDQWYMFREMWPQRTRESNS